MCLWKVRKWTVVLITLIDGNSSSPKKISLDNHYTLDFPLLRIFVLFFFLCYPVSRTSGSDSFSLCARARVHTHTPHTHARASTRERAHTHMHTHANTSSSSSTPFSSRLLHLSSLHVQTICVITTSQSVFHFLLFFLSSLRLYEYTQQSVDTLCDIMVIFQASFGVCALNGKYDDVFWWW